MEIDESDDEDDFIDDEDEDERPKKGKATKKPTPKKKPTPAKAPAKAVKKEIKDEIPDERGHDEEDSKPKPKSKYVLSISKPDLHSLDMEMGDRELWECQLTGNLAMQRMQPRKRPVRRTRVERRYRKEHIIV